MGQQVTIFLEDSWYETMVDPSNLSNRNYILFLAALVISTFFLGCAQLPNWSDIGEIVSSDNEMVDIDQLDHHFGVIRIVERNGKLEDAQQAYLEMVNLCPDYTPALHRLGVIAVRQEKLDMAIEYLEMALTHNSASAEILGDLGYAYLVRNDLGKATEILEKGFRLAPDDERISNNLGLAYGYQGRIRESLTMFRRSNPESQALTNIGFILSQIGDLEKAASYFHRALDLDPTIEQAAIGLIEVDKMLTSTTNKSSSDDMLNQNQLISSVSDH